MVRVYIKVAKNPARSWYVKASASLKYDPKPLTQGSGYSEKTLPTTILSVDLDIPESKFCEYVGSIKVQNAQPAEIKAVEDNSTIQVKEVQDGTNRE